MKVYGSNNDYQIALSIGIVISAFCAFISISFFLQTGNPHVLFLLVPASALLYLALFSMPREISLEPDRIILRALFRTASIELRDIKSIKEVYSSSALNRVDGDMEKVDMLYFLRLAGKPWRIVFFGNQIKEYKELSASLKELT